MARRMIENGENPTTTIRISSIAAALARDQGVNLPEEEVRTKFFERLDAHMDKTGPDEKTVRLLREFTRCVIPHGNSHLCQKTANSPTARRLEAEGIFPLGS